MFNNTREFKSKPQGDILLAMLEWLRAKTPRVTADGDDVVKGEHSHCANVKLSLLGLPYCPAFPSLDISLILF